MPHENPYLSPNLSQFAKELTMSALTEHGENIANQIWEDAYGRSGKLSVADVWLVLDNIHTQFMDGRKNKQMLEMLERWMKEIEAIDHDCPPL
jgi:hypothetical protein